MAKARYKVYSSGILSAPIEDVWREMRDFPTTLKMAFGDGVVDIQWVEGGSVDKIPSLIEFRLQPDGPAFREEIVARSEVDYHVIYRTVGTVLSITDYLATFHLRRITDEPDKTFMETTKDFSLVEGTDADEFLRMYEALVHQETRNMKAYFAKK
jgi:hypothetical protein